MTLKDDLIKSGLTEKQAGVYAWLLQNGEGNIMQIAKGSNCSRGTVYSVIEQLKDRGLVAENQGRRVTYLAESPSNIIDILENKENRIKEQKEFLKSAISKFIYLHQQKPSRTRVRFFEGESGLSMLREEVLRKYPDGESFEVFDYDFIPRGSSDEKHRDKVNKINRKVKCFCTSKNKKLLGKKISRGNITYNIIEMPDNASFLGTVAVCGKMSIFSSTDKDNHNVGVIIDDEKIAQTLKLLIENLKKRKKK